MIADEQRAVLDDLNEVAIQDIGTLWRNVSAIDLDSAQFRDMMIQGVPEIVSAYSGAAGDFAATWYDDAAPGLSYLATPAELAPTEQLEASTSWALRANGDAALTRMAGFTSRAVFDAARRTTVENALNEQGATWARHARVGSCSFCRLLATRTEVYASKASATTVGGRKGRTRGTQGAAERYHDHCRCTAVAVRPGQIYTPPEYVAEWDEQYEKAVQATSDGGPISLKAVLAKMDELESSKSGSSAAAAAEKPEKMAAAAANTTNSAKAVAAAKTKIPGPGKPKKAKPAGPVMTPDGRPITEIDIAKEPLVVANPKAKVGTEANPRIFRVGGNFHRTYDEGIAYFSPRWKNTPGEYDPLIAANIKRYTRGGYHDMNGYLRAYDGVVPQQTILGTTEDSIRMLDKAMFEEPKIADWTVLTRGTGRAGFNLADDEDLFSTIGKSFTEQGYWSTSVGDNPVFEGEVRMIIKTPPGTKGLYLAGKPGQTSDFVGQYGSDEGEFLLGRGSDYVVESVTKRSADASDDWQYDMVVRITGQTLVNSEVS